MWLSLACFIGASLSGAPTASALPRLRPPQEDGTPPPRNLVEIFQRDAQGVEESELQLERSEAVASYVSIIIARLGKAYVATGEPLAEEDEGALFSADSMGTMPAPLPSDGGEGYRATGVPLSVSVAQEGQLILNNASGPEDAVEDLRSAFADIGEALGGRPTRPMEFAIKAVTPVAGERGLYDVRVRVRAVRKGSDPSGTVAEARWLMRWEVPGGLAGGLAEDERRLVGIAPFVVRRTSLDGTAGGFVDVAAAVLQGPRAAALVPSIPELRAQLDAAFGVGILGHHGATVADINGDGLDDLYLCQPGGIANQLWLRGRGGESVEVAGELGLDFIDATSSALFVDLDGDGDKDAVLAIGSGLRVFVRRGNTYVQSRYIVRSGVTGLACADVDGDGRLDVYACAYAGPYAGGSLPKPYHDAENGEQNILLMNRTRAPDQLAFVDETIERGLGPGASRFSFAAAFEDVDGDADADLYVANDFGRNALYFNDGTGRFHEAAEAAGAMDIAAGMGAAFGDMNGDGAPDLYVSNMESSAGRRVTGTADFLAGTDPALRAVFQGHAKGNSLFMNTGLGTFRSSGLASQGRWAWGSIPVDLDGNGDLDLFVPNGFVTGTDGERPDL